jgi:hypothetical protein
LVRQPELWNADTFRTQFPGTPHQASDVDDILIRFSDTAKCDTQTKVIGDNTPIWHPAAKCLPQIKPVVLNLMRAVDAWELGRIIISRLRPGGVILPHSDDTGEYVLTPDRARYHIILQNSPGSLYHCGDESVFMPAGSVWWFNAHQFHSVVNGGADDRISLMVDVRTWP